MNETLYRSDPTSISLCSHWFGALTRGGPELIAIMSFTSSGMRSTLFALVIC